MQQKQTTSELLKEYAENPTIELRNRIVEENLYIVDILIRKYLGKGVDYDDLYQVGAMALVSAVERFDPAKGYEFQSFATPTILGEIKKYFRDKEWSLKVPRRMKENAGKVQEAKEKLTGKLGRVPTNRLSRRWRVRKLTEHTRLTVRPQPPTRRPMPQPSKNI